MKTTPIAEAAVSSVKSRYWRDAGRTLEWEPLGGDTKEAFDRKFNNISDDAPLPYREQLEDYKINPVTYKLNNEGFRGDNFNTKDEFTVFLGCSHTTGCGHYFENTWPYHMMEHLGWDSKMANMSNGGVGIASGFRLLYKYKNILKIKRIFCFFPHWARYEFKEDKGEWIIVQPQILGEMLSHFGEEVQKNSIAMRTFGTWLINFETIWWEYCSHVRAIYSIAQELNVPLYFAPQIDRKYRSKPPNTNVFYARDQHSSTYIYYGIFKQFKDLIDNNDYITPEKLDKLLLTRSPMGDEPLLDVNADGNLVWYGDDNINPPEALNKQQILDIEKRQFNKKKRLL